MRAYFAQFVRCQPYPCCVAKKAQRANSDNCKGTEAFVIQSAHEVFFLSLVRNFGP